MEFQTVSTKFYKFFPSVSKYLQIFLKISSYFPKFLFYNFYYFIYTYFPFKKCSIFFTFKGAGSGIGRAVAIRFAQEGATVIAADRNLKAAEETARKLGGKQHKPFPTKLVISSLCNFVYFYHVFF